MKDDAHGGEWQLVAEFDVLELKADEVNLQNWGMPQPWLQVHDREGFSQCSLYRELGISKQVVWYHLLHMLHWMHFCFHLAALLQIMQGKFGVYGIFVLFYTIRIKIW